MATSNKDTEPKHRTSRRPERSGTVETATLDLAKFLLQAEVDYGIAVFSDRPVGTASTPSRRRKVKKH